jgi:hypothetical protein
MPDLRRFALRAASATVIAIPLYAVCLSAALASSGHAHQRQDGFVPGGIVEVAGTVAAIAILHVLATWFFRHRGNVTERRAGGNPQTDHRLHVPYEPEAHPADRLTTADPR